jgi:hypothetical protein
MMKHQLHCQSIRIKFLLFTVLTVLGLGCGQKVFFVAEYSAFEYSETKGSRTTTDPHCIIGGADSFYIVYPVHYQLEVFDTVSSHDPEVPTLDTIVRWHQQVFGPYSFEGIREGLRVGGRNIKGQRRESDYYSLNANDTTYQYALETNHFDSISYGGFYLAYSGVDTMFLIDNESRKGHKFFTSEKREMLKYAGQSGATAIIYYDEDIYLPLLMKGEVFKGGNILFTKLICNSIQQISEANYDSVFRTVILDTFSLPILNESIRLQPIEY